MKKALVNKKDIIKKKAVELLALNPHLSNQDICNKLNISLRTLDYWKSDPDFAEAIYLRYMIDFGAQIPAVLNAMVREAQAGNVQAGRLVLEHSGKLVKNITVSLDSPFEKFMRGLQEVEVIEDKDIIDIAEEIDIDVELPERKIENQEKRAIEERGATIKIIKEEEIKIVRAEEKKKKRNEKQKDWYKWKKRAKALNIKPLPNKRPTPAQRKDWEQSIIEAESKLCP